MTEHEPAQEKMQQLQQLEHQLQSMVAQKQQIQSQMFELDSALSELKETTKAFKIVGGIMVAKTPSELSEEMNQKKDVLALRMQAIEKQEKNMREKAKSLQQDVVQSMKK